MFWVTSYNLKEDKAQKYKEFILSEEAKKLYDDVEKETGMRFIDVYWSILGFGDFECEEWWEVPDWATLDKIRGSESINRLFSKFFELDIMDPAGDQHTRMLRTTEDVMVFASPEKEEK